MLNGLFDADRGVDPHGLGVHQVTFGKVFDLGLKGRRKQKRLTAHRNAPNDGVDVVDEPHVEHAVRLVEDEEARAPHRHPSLPEEIEQASRGGHEQVATLRQLGLLSAARSSPVGEHRAKTDVFAEPFGLASDLNRQLARRTDHDRMGSIPSRLERLQDGEQISECLSGSGLRNPHEIVPGQDQGNRLELDGCGARIAGFVQRALELRAKAELPERIRHPQRAWISPSSSRRFEFFAAAKIRSTRGSVGSTP